jgi:hypothetical protein
MMPLVRATFLLPEIRKEGRKDTEGRKEGGR